MSKLVGNYAHVKSENLDEYFKGIGVPYMGRKMMSMTSPTLNIENEGDDWTITQTTTFRTNVNKFKLGHEFEEEMPGGKLKNVASVVDGKLIIESIGPNGEKMMRIYESTDAGLTLTLKLEKGTIEAKRHFKTVP